MPPKYRSVDDPTVINEFLVAAGIAPLPVPVSVEVCILEKIQRYGRPRYPRQSKKFTGEELKEYSSGNDTFNDDRFAFSPSTSEGIIASPERLYTAMEGFNLLLDPIQDHEWLEIFTKLSDPNSTLADSKHAPRRLYTKIPSRYQTGHVHARNPNTGGSVNKLDYPSERPFTRTTVQQEVLDRIAIRNAKLARNNPAPVTPITPLTPSMASNDTPSNLTSQFEEDVIAKFKARGETNDKTKENMKTATALPTVPKTLDPNALTWSFPADTVSYTLEEGQAQFAKAKAAAQGAEAFESIKAQNTAVTSPAKASVVQDAISTTPVKTGVTQDIKVEAVAPAKSAQAIFNDAKADFIANTAALSLDVKKEPGSPENSSIVVAASEDPAERTNATHFTSWGTPQARATPRAMVRKVILRGLPVSADLTLVQSIVHGGAIDNFALGANGTAQVTFTNPEACDAYYTKYLNGVTVKDKGRNYVVFVEKNTDVNVVSGMLQGQLEAGASRCVRAVGADNDWGMGALIKLAEGKTRKGKVEHIADAWRNEIRTIVFRFTSIGDAVTFKSMLVRHEDWEACNIQFTDDPCEKATGVHLE